jgi:single-strand DNA-binding protein
VSLNVAVVRGSCSSAPEVRTLDSGRVLAVLQVTTKPDADAPAVSVPVVVWNPPAWVERIEAGDEIVALGRVRRRFYRAAAGAAAKTELEASVVARSNDRRRVTAVLRRAYDALEVLAE